MERIQKIIRILLVDDEEIIRYGINAILQCESAIEVVGEACNGQEAVALVTCLKPDMVLMDINMPLMNGLVATEKICQAHSDVKVLILTTSTKNSHLQEAIQKGASGYLLKNIPPEDFLHIIQSTYKGCIHLDPAMVQQL